MFSLARIFPVIAVLALLVSACASGEGTTVERDVEATPHEHTPPAKGQNNMLAPHEYEPPRVLGNFRLIDQHGEPFHLSDARGKAVFVYVGYTHCPDICPTTLGNWISVREQLGGDAEDVEFVMITSDPERDTPDVLAEYMGNFDPSFVGLTGRIDDLLLVYADFGTIVEIHASPGDAHYDVNHRSSSYILDGDGRLRMKLPYGLGAAEMTEAVRTVLDAS